MKSEIQYLDWGLIDYKDAWNKQKILFDKLIEQKSHFENIQKEFVQQWFIVCEHPHV
jgi:lipoyl(octanoyl) transferase